MLVYDCHLPVLFHGTFLAKEFQALLTPSTPQVTPIINYKGKEILNLCLITMDDWEDFENRIVQRDLSDLMIEYSKQIPFRHVSAGDFLAHIQSEKFCAQPGIVAESEAALCRAVARLFGPLP